VKYIKSYKLFESISDVDQKIISEAEGEIKDILVELNDLHYSVIVNATIIQRLLRSPIRRDMNRLQIKISIENSGDKIDHRNKEFLDPMKHLSRYMDQEGYSHSLKTHCLNSDHDTSFDDMDSLLHYLDKYGPGSWGASIIRISIIIGKDIPNNVSEDLKFSDKFDKHKWVELNRKDRGELKREIWELVDNAYGPLGGHVRVKDQNSVVGDKNLSFWSAIDVDDDPYSDVVIFARKSESGYKISGWGHDGGKEAKKGLIKKLASLLRKKGFWIEVSGKPATILSNMGANRVNDRRTIEKLFPNSKIKMLDNGYYKRTLENGDTEEEIILGNPIINRVNESFSESKKVLYLHGLDSYPKEDRLEILNSEFGKVFSPKIDWRNKEERTKLFSKFCDLIKSNNITNVVGSSMGGQMAFYLSLYCNIDGLCFNPAFNYMYNDLGFEIGDKFTKKIIIKLGEHDNVISHERSIDFISQFEGDISYEILDMGHDVNIEVFRDSVSELS
jgi:hypothetical protein